MNEDAAGEDDYSSHHARLHLEQVTDWETLVVEARYSPSGLASRCGFSVRHLQRHILKRYGKKLGEFISAIRMQKAYNLLRAGFTIKETAIGLGFKQISHFCRCFKHHFDATASTVLHASGMKSNENGSDDQQLQLGLFQSPIRPTRPKSDHSPGSRNN